MGIFKIIGNTPLVKLSYFSSGMVNIYAKLEGMNPGGSIKDRAAFFMIKAAELSGALNKEKIILEATSGNTGIALSMIGARKGYKSIIVMPETASEERIKIIKSFGADVILTKGEFGTDGAILKARQIYEEFPENYFMPNQFDNIYNMISHYKTTGPEIFKKTKGKIDILVAGVGTTGTIMGTGKYLKERIKNIKIVGVEPKPVHSIQGLKNLSVSIRPKIFNSSLIDEMIVVEDNLAFKLTRELAVKEGILAGISSGAALSGALKIAGKLKKGNIVVIFPDRGERYLSTPIFSQIRKRRYCK